MSLSLNSTTDISCIGPTLYWTIEDPTTTDYEKQESLTEIMAHLKSMVMAGWSVNTQDSEGHTVLHWLIITDAWYPYQRTFIEELVTLGINVNKQDYRGYTALIWAALFNKSGAVKLLLKLGADKDIVDKQGKTAMYYAVENSYGDISNQLI